MKRKSIFEFLVFFGGMIFARFFGWVVFIGAGATTSISAFLHNAGGDTGFLAFTNFVLMAEGVVPVILSFAERRKKYQEVIGGKRASDPKFQTELPSKDVFFYEENGGLVIESPFGKMMIPEQKGYHIEKLSNGNEVKITVF